MSAETTAAESYGPSAILTPANAVTMARLALAPVAFWMMSQDPNQSSWAICGVWFILSTSDFLDGTLARRYGTTRSGAFLDPLADKVLVLGGVAVMCMEGRFPWIAFLLIAGRELVISVFRSGYVKRGLAVPATKLAKWKTFLQLAAVGWVTLPPTASASWLYLATLWIGVAAGLVSGAQYLMAGSRSATSMAR